MKILTDYLNWQLPLGRGGFGIALGGSFAVSLVFVLALMPTEAMQAWMSAEEMGALPLPKSYQLLLLLPWWVLIPAFYRRMQDIGLAHLKSNTIFLFIPSLFELILPTAWVMSLLTPLAIWGLLVFGLTGALLWLPSAKA